MDAAAVRLFRPKPSRLVKKTTVNIAKNERQNDSSRPESVVHFMNKPPVLQSKAAAKIKSRGVAGFPCIVQKVSRRLTRMNAALICDHRRKSAAQNISLRILQFTQILPK